MRISVTWYYEWDTNTKIREMNTSKEWRLSDQIRGNPMNDIAGWYTSLESWKEHIQFRSSWCEWRRFLLVQPGWQMCYSTLAVQIVSHIDNGMDHVGYICNWKAPEIPIFTPPRQYLCNTRIKSRNIKKRAILRVSVERCSLVFNHHAPQMGAEIVSITYY